MLRAKCCGSMALAVASATLFVLCELLTASSARTGQLLVAAVLFAALAAAHTHTVAGKALTGWRLWQPFSGGAGFCFLQAIGWTSLGVVVLLSICSAGALFAFCAACGLRGLHAALGVTQLVAQVSLVLSLTRFDSATTPARGLAMCRRLAGTFVDTWCEEGLPLVPFAAVCLAGAVGGVSLAACGILTSRAIGFILLASLVCAQVAGLHIMWTVTWLLCASCAHLIGSEDGLAVMACMGTCCICAPWYIGRIVFWHHDYPTRAMFGLSGWCSDSLLGSRGTGYVHTSALNWLRVTFWQMDAATHVLPACILLQQCAKLIRPVHVVAAFLLTLAWCVTLSLHHVVVDWEAVHRGRLVLRRWGGCSLYEPDKVAQIYAFDNRYISSDAVSFSQSMPGFLFIGILSCLVALIIAALPASAECFFALGGGAWAELPQLCMALVTCALSGAVTGSVTVYKMLRC